MNGFTLILGQVNIKTTSGPKEWSFTCLLLLSSSLQKDRFWGLLRSFGK